MTLTCAVGGPAGMARTRNGPTMPTPNALQHDCLSAESPRQLARPQQRGQSVRRHRAANHPLLAIHHLDDLST